MAQEIERKEVQPSKYTDQFSLAVLLFHMFMVGHPLLGKLYWQRLSSGADEPKLLHEMLGLKPLFIFNPDDQTNEPDDCQQFVNLYWRLYPKFLRDLFTRAFTTGLNDPGARVTESEWRLELARLQDNIVYCPCGTQNFYDGSRSEETRCWQTCCGKPIRLPYRIRIGSRTITLNHDRRLFSHHLNTTSDDSKTPVAEVTQNPKQPTQWGLKNMGNQKWVMTLPDTSVHDIEPGRSVILSKGKKVNFGNAEGEICAWSQSLMPNDDGGSPSLQTLLSAVRPGDLVLFWCPCHKSRDDHDDLLACIKNGRRECNLDGVVLSRWGLVVEGAVVNLDCIDYGVNVEPLIGLPMMPDPEEPIISREEIERNLEEYVFPEAIELKIIEERGNEVLLSLQEKLPGSLPS